MSENSINPISSVRPVEAASAPPVQFQPELAVVARSGAPAEAAPQAEAVALTGLEIPAEPKAAREADKPALPVGNGADVSLHFRVDEKTRDVTVFVVDRRSKQVLRSIPASELAKLQAGELLKLTA